MTDQSPQRSHLFPLNWCTVSNLSWHACSLCWKGNYELRHSQFYPLKKPIQWKWMTTSEPESPLPSPPPDMHCGKYHPATCNHPPYTVTGHQTFATANTWWTAGTRVLKNVSGNWLWGKAIIKPGRLEPHPIQRRGQRLERPSTFWGRGGGGNSDQKVGQPKKRPTLRKDYKNLFCIQKCNETHVNRQTYLKCHASNCVAMILSLGINLSSGGRISCVVVDSGAEGHHQSSS